MTSVSPSPRVTWVFASRMVWMGANVPPVRVAASASAPSTRGTTCSVTN